MSLAQSNISTISKISTPRPSNIWGTVTFWMARAKQRRQLALLEDSRLQDMGITLEEAMEESAKPFWQD